MKYLTFVFLLVSFTSQASCYVVGDLKGFSTRQIESFEIGKDGISSQKNSLLNLKVMKVASLQIT
ncbi:hypothetical protein [Vibrio diabolicus]|uniref:hypothetical protein n=1 Tax=Vibrio diabolicus TaxID=50719 RepID=UPI00215CB0DF|nr:hypothetical protein [Vibrio diabolicus]MCR9307311.1 hypothetical protein [Vibrio diabolicus]